MTGIVYPRPHKWAVNKKGQRYKAPLRPNEEWTDPDTGKTVKAGPKGSTWSWQLTTGTKRTGRKHHSRGGFATREDAKADLAEVVAKHNKGDKRPLMKRTDQLVSEHLDEWLESCRTRQNKPLKPSTHAGYRNAIDAWIKPEIGDKPLADLDSGHLVELYKLLREKGGKGRKVRKPAPRTPDGTRVTGDGGWTWETKPLGTRSVQLVHTLLRKSLAAAVPGKIPVSPVDHIPDDDRPTHTATKQANRVWEPATAAQFLTHTADDRLHALWALGLDSGARRGELAALRWQTDDVEGLDLDAGVMRVRCNRVLVAGKPQESTPKSERSFRYVELHAETVRALKAHRKRQAAERLKAGPAWEDGGYVFCDQFGRPYCDQLSAFFDQAQEGFDAKRLTFHGMRHTSASALLKAGVPFHVVSERLGHASVSITMDVYAHVDSEQHTDAATKIGQALYGATGTDGGDS